MGRQVRLLILSMGAIFGGVVPAWISPSVIQGVSDPVAKATIASAFIALFGVVFGALFTEILAYYKDRATGMERKWELIFPLLRDYYNPWIQASKYLSKFLRDMEKELKSQNEITPRDAARGLFYLTFFYTRRLKFSIEAGGYPILADHVDEETVMKAYYNVENSLEWAGTKAATQSKVSELQQKFLDREKTKKPYRSYSFIAEATNPHKKPLYEDSQQFSKWLTSDRANEAATALEKFESAFQKGTDKLYVGWLS